jgi:hypothetical protein
MRLALRFRTRYSGSGLYKPAVQTMNWKIITGILLLVAAAVVTVTMVRLKKHSQPPVAVTLRIAVTPAEQVDFVAGRGNSAQFKYLVGKQSGMKPGLAQKLTFKPVPNTSLIEARIGVLTKEEGQRCLEVFVPMLQDLCGRKAKLTLAEQSIR